MCWRTSFDTTAFVIAVSLLASSLWARVSIPPRLPLQPRRSALIMCCNSYNINGFKREHTKPMICPNQISRYTFKEEKMWSPWFCLRFQKIKLFIWWDCEDLEFSLMSVNSFIICVLVINVRVYFFHLGSVQSHHYTVYIQYQRHSLNNYFL